MASSRLHAAVERPDGQRDGLRHYPAGPAADRGRRPAGLHVPGRPADLGVYPRLRADRAPGRGHRGPPRQAAPDALVRRGADADHRLGPADRRARPAHPLAAVRGGDHRGRVHRVLRRVLPELPARPGVEAGPGRRERQARRDPVVRAGDRAGPGRCPGRGGRRRRGDGRGRDLLRRLGGVPTGHPHPRGSGNFRPGAAPRAASRNLRGPLVRAQAPDPAQHRGVHRDREPVRQHGRCPADHLPGPGPAP